MKSHQLGKVLHWQIALVRPKHLPKGKERVPPPQTSGRQVRLPAGEEGGHIYVLRTLQCSAALSLLLIRNTPLQRETSHVQDFD